MRKWGTLKLPPYLSMIKEGTDKQINKIHGSPSLYEISKYKDLEIKIEKMGHLQTTTIPRYDQGKDR